MSVRDPRHWSDESRRGARTGRGTLTELSDRLASARRAGDPAPEELERLVTLLAQSDYEPSDRLTQALQGLARWTSAEKPQPAPEPEPQRRQPVPAEIESRLVDFANSLAERPKPATPARPAPRPAETRTPPIASLRAALAEISQRQKALDADEDRQTRRAPSHDADRRAEPRRAEPVREPERRAEPRRTEPSRAAAREADHMPEGRRAERAPAPAREPEPRRSEPARSEASRPLFRGPDRVPEPARAEPLRTPAREPEPRAETRRPEPVRAPAPRAEVDEPHVTIEPRRTYDPQAQAAKPAASAALEALRSEIDRLARSVADLPTRREVESLSHEMSELSGRVSTDRPARLDPVSLGAIDALVGEVDRMRRDAASPQTIAHLAEELHTISVRLDSIEPSSSTALDVLARRIEEIRSDLTHFPRAAAIESLGDEIQSVIARLDAQEREAGPTRQAVMGLASRVEALDGRVADVAEAVAIRDDAFQRANDTLRAEIETLPRAKAVTDLGRQIEALTESFKNRSAIGPALKAVEGLTSRVESLDGKIEALGSARRSDTEWLADTLRDEIAASSRPNALEGLERQIATLSARLSEPRDTVMSGEIRALTARIDGLGDSVLSVAHATSARSAAFERIEDSVRAIADQMVQSSATAGVAGLEAEVNRLVDGLERNDGRLDDLNAAFAGLAARIERSCEDLGARFEKAPKAAASAGPTSGVDSDIQDEIARSLAELRSSAAQSERRAADALDAVRSTLERMLDRMEQMEPAPLRERPISAFGPDSRREDAEPRIDAGEAARAAARRALAEIAAGDTPRVSRVEDEDLGSYTDLSPDHPIEPGSGAPKFEASGPNAASFIAAARRASAQPSSEFDPEPFEAEAKAGPSAVSGMIAKLKASKRPFLLGLAATLIVFAALYVANGITGDAVDAPPPPAPQSQLAPEPAPERDASAPAAAVEAPREQKAEAAPAAQPEETPQPPRAEEPAPAPQNHSATTPPVPAAPAATAAATPQPAAAGPAGAAPQPFGIADAAGLPKSRTVEWKEGEPLTTGSIAKTEPGGLPDGIGGSTLRERAAAGDAAAQLEVADRLLEGRNVEPDAASAAVWLERAAAQNLAPAQHRLGSLYEKGRGVGRDVATARRWYEQAAAAGNVRAMHNLGVVYAEGGLGKPDFATATVWFRMAAERGLVDSQYNLAVLEARGLSGRRDLVEAYKWFALAALQGDDDAGKKRDEVGKALGSKLSAAKTAAETFRPRAIEAAANDVPAPANGWDAASDQHAAAPR